MKIALLADVHSNLEALRACLAHAAREGAEMHVFLGDLVGYGADPIACLDLVADYAAQGAIVVRGNHDEATCSGLAEDMNLVAREAIYWTRARLGPAQRTFLSSLPLTARRNGLFFVHASADAPARWTYVTSEGLAARCMEAAGAAITFIGHVHQPALFFSTGRGVRVFGPLPRIAIPLSARRRWLAIPGSVGQPRDGNNAAAYALFDEEDRTLTYHRVPYDTMAAAQKVLAAGLPEGLAWRLLHGI